eukprot:6047804-Amphidinium_carterae.1
MALKMCTCVDVMKLALRDHSEWSTASRLNSKRARCEWCGFHCAVVVSANLVGKSCEHCATCALQ